MAGIGIAIGIDAHRGEGLNTLRDRLQRLADVGFTHAELSAKGLGVLVGGRLQPVRLKALKEALDGCPVRLTLHGTAISSARAGNLVDVTTPNQHAVVAADLALAGEIGATVLVQHSGMLRDFWGDDDALAAGLARERDSLRALGDEADRLGIQIAVENTDPVGTYLARRAYGIRLDLLAEQIQAVDHPRVGVCLDTGHAFLTATYLGTEYLPAIRDIAPLVSHLHVSDNLGRVQLDRDADSVESLILGDGDLHLLPGWGTVPLAEIMSMPFAQDPIAIIEMRALFFPHVQEAYDAVSSLAASAVPSM